MNSKLKKTIIACSAIAISCLLINCTKNSINKKDEIVSSKDISNDATAADPYNTEKPISKNSQTLSQSVATAVPSTYTCGSNANDNYAVS